MDFWEALKASMFASFWFSWIAVPIAYVPTWAIASSSPNYRRDYFIAGLSGGVAGEICSTSSLFLSMWLWCRGQESCNTAQGDIALIYLIPLGTAIGSLLASAFTWMTLRIIELSPTNHLFRRSAWAGSILFQLTLFISATWLLADLMA